MATISFDIGGVLDEGADDLRPILGALVANGNKVIVVTAIGHGKPEKWGYTEEERHATSSRRLRNKEYVQGDHWHELFVVPDPDSGHITGRYKDFVLRREGALVHVDDNQRVMEAIRSCKALRYFVGIDMINFGTALDLLIINGAPGRQRGLA